MGGGGDETSGLAEKVGGLTMSKCLVLADISNFNAESGKLIGYCYLHDFR